jgi:hypothetical protein
MSTGTPRLQPGRRANERDSLSTPLFYTSISCRSGRRLLQNGSKYRVEALRFQPDDDPSAPAPTLPLAGPVAAARSLAWLYTEAIQGAAAPSAQARMRL